MTGFRDLGRWWKTFQRLAAFSSQNKTEDGHVTSVTKAILKGISPNTGDSCIYRSSSFFGLTVSQLPRLLGPIFMPWSIRRLCSPRVLYLSTRGQTSLSGVKRRISSYVSFISLPSEIMKPDRDAYWLHSRDASTPISRSYLKNLALHLIGSSNRTSIWQWVASFQFFRCRVIQPTLAFIAVRTWKTFGQWVFCFPLQSFGLGIQLSFSDKVTDFLYQFTLSQKSFSVVLLGRLCRFLRCPRVLSCGINVVAALN